MMDLLSGLRALLGENNVLTSAEDRAPYEADWRQLARHPALCVALPQTTEQVARTVKLCAAAGANIVPQGGNTSLVAGGVPAPGGGQIILAFKRMNRILALDATGETLTVQAGATLHAVRQAAAAAGKLFPVSFAAEGSAQIGGVISTNAGGVQVLSYGTLRAQVLGLEVVLADGRVWNGLRALTKDNTGYDLKQLFCGAEGTLGLITAAVLKLQPEVKARATALAAVADAADAMKLFELLRAAAGKNLTLCEFISGPAMALAAKHGPAGAPPFAATTYVLTEFSSPAASMALEALLEATLAEAFQAGCVQNAVIAKSEAERARLLALREAVPEGELREGGAIKHDIAVPLAHIPAMVRAAENLAAQTPACRLNIFGHIGDGNLHINFRPAPGHSLAALPAEEISRAVHALAMEFGGSFSAEHGIGQFKRGAMAAHKSAVELALMRAVKSALDPGGVFNPAKVL